jgi:hypothetical protein
VTPVRSGFKAPAWVIVVQAEVVGDARRGLLGSMLGEVGHGEGIDVMARWTQLGEATKQRQGGVTVARHGAVGARHCGLSDSQRGNRGLALDVMQGRWRSLARQRGLR